VISILIRSSKTMALFMTIPAKETMPSKVIKPKKDLVIKSPINTPITPRGMVIKTPVKDMRVMGRATQGVKVVKLHGEDKVTDLVKVIEDLEDAEGTNGENN